MSKLKRKEKIGRNDFIGLFHQYIIYHFYERSNNAQLKIIVLYENSVWLYGGNDARNRRDVTAPVDNWTDKRIGSTGNFDGYWRICTIVLETLFLTVNFFNPRPSVFLDIKHSALSPSNDAPREEKLIKFHRDRGNAFIARCRPPSASDRCQDSRNFPTFDLAISPTMDYPFVTIR